MKHFTFSEKDLYFSYNYINQIIGCFPIYSCLEENNNNDANNVRKLGKLHFE